MTEPTFDIMIWRHRNRLTQKQFAQLVGAHEVTVYRWETGGGVRRKAWPDIDDYNAGRKCIVVDTAGHARFEPMAKAAALQRAGKDVRVSTTASGTGAADASAVNAILSAIGPERLAELVAQHISAGPAEKKPLAVTIPS